MYDGEAVKLILYAFEEGMGLRRQAGSAGLGRARRTAGPPGGYLAAT